MASSCGLDLAGSGKHLTVWSCEQCNGIVFISTSNAQYTFILTILIL